MSMLQVFLFAKNKRSILQWQDCCTMLRSYQENPFVISICCFIGKYSLPGGFWAGSFTLAVPFKPFQPRQFRPVDSIPAVPFKALHPGSLYHLCIDPMSLLYWTPSKVIFSALA